MRMNTSKQTTFYCFSPPVMLATFAIEIGLLLYAVWRYKMTTLTRLAAAILSCLALFQLAEYFVCGGLGVQAATWSRVGYVAITALPPLGLHLAHQIGKKPLSYSAALAYATGMIWIAVFSLSQQAFSGHVCAGNYVIFQLKTPLGGLYFMWYYAVLLGTMWFAVRAMRHASRRVIKALQAQVIGYTLFMLPTAVVNSLFPDTISGLPSIMCGFAVLFAITITLGILPLEKERIAKVAARAKH